MLVQFAALCACSCLAVAACCACSALLLACCAQLRIGKNALVQLVNNKSTVFSELTGASTLFVLQDVFVATQAGNPKLITAAMNGQFNLFGSTPVLSQ